MHDINALLKPLHVGSVTVVLGVDLGIKAMAMGSDGTVIENAKALRTELKRLKRLHRRLSRKEKGSKNRDKACKRLARKYARIAHVRRNAHHQATSRLTRAHFSPEERAARRAQIASTLPEPKAKVKPRKGKRSLATETMEAPPLSERIAKKVKKKQIKRRLRQVNESDATLRPRVVVLEDLHVEGMKRNRKLALAISDVGLGEFRRQMSYKTLWQGEDFLLADRFYPSTKKMLQPDVWQHQRGDGPLRVHVLVRKTGVWSYHRQRFECCP
jgi:transposase